ncbi:PREDICTED: uncharacterized protein LOC104816224 [Tarenaya hassleriana]|uniref:uncharacterized protein LOC104816224 n=1 Tax=Tarenaya hassleriana TaxID=28532 RepID=UPI00053C5A00|nr:PREDICTED: uncharacterized protein LOC104816224 [Tarenaya hassleriana]
MVESSGEAKMRLRLLVDEEKNKVVWAEAEKDFAEVLFSFLVLPVGTIVRLLEKRIKSGTLVIGCLDNLYRSVSEMGIYYFRTQGCMDRLLFPQNVMEDQCRRLKINIDDTDNRATKYFVCPNSESVESCCKLYSNIYATSKCSCGRLMNREVRSSEEDRVAGSVYVSNHTSFIITDDMTVAVNSPGLFLNSLKRLGYADVAKLGEMFLDVGHEEVMSLLECLFTSDTPLTDAFLRKQSSHVITKTYQMPAPVGLGNGGEAAEPDPAITLNVCVRKQDSKFLYFECGDDFVDLLFTFLGMSVVSVWKNAGDGIILGCIGNLCRSFKDLSSTEWTDASFQPPKLYRYGYTYHSSYSHSKRYGFTRNCSRRLENASEKLVPVNPVDDNCKFVKEKTRFFLSDDMVIKPWFSTSPISLLKELHVRLDDVEMQVISIRRKEIINLVGASLVTPFALSTALRKLLPKKPKEEPYLTPSKRSFSSGDGS